MGKEWVTRVFCIPQHIYRSVVAGGNVCSGVGKRIAISVTGKEHECILLFLDIVFSCSVDRCLNVCIFSCFIHEVNHCQDQGRVAVENYTQA